MLDLGTLGGSTSFATAVNNSGVVIGDSYLQGNATSHAFVYASGQMTDLGSLGGSVSTAVAVNSAGQVIGNAYTAGNTATRAFVYGGGRMTDLGTLGGSNSYVLGINSLGQIIGTSDIAGNKAQHSFLYSNGKMLDLSTLFPGLTSFVAAGINDAMEIIGTAVTKSGLVRGLIVTAVPETDGALMVLTGFGLLGLVARLRRRRPAATLR
jgi:probable HAF family extracellular repeat protein